MTAVLSLILSLYAVLLVAFLVGWVRIRRQTMPIRTTSPPAVTIVVAVRNEEANIKSLIRDLSAMAFARDRFEIIIVDDHSTDATITRANALIATSVSNVRLLELPVGLEGKKAALEFGIQQARFDIIATTDADCTLSKNWLTCVSSYFELAETKLVIGAVKLMGDQSFFSQLQVTEFVSLTGTTAAAIGLGYPIMCNGANLAFRKSVFMEVHGYEGNRSIASGDDEFLMRKIVRRFPKGIRFLNYYEAVVNSVTLDSFRDFFQQRIRWAGKWKKNSDPVTRLLAVFIFVAQLSFAVLLIRFNYLSQAIIGLLTAKLFLEGVFIFWVGRFLDRGFNILAFMTLQIIYPFYVGLVGVFSLFSTFAWKGRNYKSQSQG